MFTNVPHIPYTDIHGNIEAIQPLKPCKVETKIGKITPIYHVEDHGRLKLTPVKLDKFGRIKSIQPQTPIKLQTSIGKLYAEFITFYPNGNIRRVFPLNGKLSGYWNEKNEYELAEDVTVNTSVGVITAKPIYFHFYETGELKSITFWPKERVKINLNNKKITIKTGISFYKTGELKSYEPALPEDINTPIGIIKAFDPSPIGINGENNSLSFLKKGKVNKISTINNNIEVYNEKHRKTYEPKQVRDLCNDELLKKSPLSIEFNKDFVIFRHGLKTIGKESINSRFIIT